MPSEFPFEEGDWVLVKHREAGQMRSKFVARCTRIRDSAVGGTPQATFDLEFGVMNSVSIRPYEAEFEAVEDPSVVNF